MIERQTINGKEVWFRIDPQPMQRSNPNTIPTEYFTASYFIEEPAGDQTGGEVIQDEEGAPRLFESPVAALNYARKRFEQMR